MKRTALYEVNYIEAGYSRTATKWFEKADEATEFARTIQFRGGGADITKHYYGAERANEIMTAQRE